MRNFIRYASIGLLALTLPLAIVAKSKEQPKMVASSSMITNLSTTLTKAEGQAGFAVKFPAEIPATKNLPAYFLSVDTKPDNYTLSVDATATCNGAHYCNIGAVQGVKGGKITMQKNMKNRVITQEVKLANGTNAYFTPGHAMGDYWSASVQVIANDTLYTLTWDLPANKAKKFLVTMAESLIK